VKHVPVEDGRNDVEKWLEQEGAAFSDQFWTSLLTLNHRLRTVGELSFTEPGALGSAGLTLDVPKLGPTTIDGSASGCEEDRCVEFYFSMFHQAPGTMSFDSWAAESEVSIDCRCEPPCEAMHRLGGEKTITDGPELAVETMSEYLERFLAKTEAHGVAGWLNQA
jgi:hypothetical protein